MTGRLILVAERRDTYELEGESVTVADSDTARARALQWAAEHPAESWALDMHYLGSMFYRVTRDGRLT